MTVKRTVFVRDFRGGGGAEEIGPGVSTKGCDGERIEARIYVGYNGYDGPPGHGGGAEKLFIGVVNSIILVS